MKQKAISMGIVACSAALGLCGGMAIASAASPALPVVAGATALSADEKADVTGKCGCTPHDTKPGYGFGTTGHYGPPGQGFTPHNTWRQHAAGDGLTPTGRPLPPRAF